VWTYAVSGISVLIAFAGTGPSTLDHFKDEVKTQLRELTWQKRPPK
jgi:hypothetical protein